MAPPSFPGFVLFAATLEAVGGLPLSWIEVLRNARGVYLLVHRGSGRQCVGSATGNGGFFERWLAYANGHGGNVALKELADSPASFDVSILEVCGSDATPGGNRRTREHLETQTG
jgi:hypothetical protein